MSKIIVPMIHVPDVRKTVELFLDHVRPGKLSHGLYG